MSDSPKIVLGPPHAVKRFHHRRPEPRRVFVLGEGNAVRTRREQIPADEEAQADPPNRELRSTLRDLQEVPEAVPEAQGHIGPQLPRGGRRHGFPVEGPQQEVVVEQDPFDGAMRSPSQGMPKTGRHFGKAPRGQVCDPNLKALRNHCSNGPVTCINDGIVRG